MFTFNYAISNFAIHQPYHMIQTSAWWMIIDEDNKNLVVVSSPASHFDQDRSIAFVCSSRHEALRVYIYIHTLYTYIYIYIYKHTLLVCACVCIYIYIYIMCVYIYIFTYIYINNVYIFILSLNILLIINWNTNWCESLNLPHMPSKI